MAEARAKAIEKFRDCLSMAEIVMDDGVKVFRVFTGSGKPRADIVCCPPSSTVEAGCGLIAVVGGKPEFTRMPVDKALQVIDSDGPEFGWVLLLNAEDWHKMRHVNSMHHRVH